MSLSQETKDKIIKETGNEFKELLLLPVTFFAFLAEKGLEEEFDTFSYEHHDEIAKLL